METLGTLEEFTTIIEQEKASLILFGGRQCNVCHALRPKIEELFPEQYPKMKLYYIDCHETTELCSQKGVFSLPMIQVYLEGQKFMEEVRSFSLEKLVADLKRPYKLLFDQ